MMHPKQKGQPIDNPYVNGVRWYPPQILKDCKDEEGFLVAWIDNLSIYPEVTDKVKREEVLKLAWATAMKNIDDNEAAGTPIVEKKK